MNLSFASNPIWILGTDTHVGKTHVARLLASAWQQQGPVTYLKPFQCGPESQENPSDTSMLSRQGVNAQTFYHFQAPLAPLAASELEKRNIDLNTVKQWCLDSLGKQTILEGVGGVMVPLVEQVHFAAWASSLKIPCLLVARGGLGTLNHTLLSAESLMIRGWRIDAIVLNPGLDQSYDAAIGNAEILKRMLPCPVVIAS